MDDGTAPPSQYTTGRRRTVSLRRAESLGLLAGVRLGRIVFTERALPAIRPVNHVLADGHIIIRTHHSAALAGIAGPPHGPGVIVAYEADEIDPTTHLGWSVIVTGPATLVHDPADLQRYQAMLEPWIDQAMDHAVRIRPDLVTGYRLTTIPTH